MGYLGLLSLNGYDPTTPHLFDNRPIELGNHLRWVLQSDLGLPQKFIIYRTSHQNILQDVNSIFKKNKGKDYLKEILPSICSYIRNHASPFAELNYSTWNALDWLAKHSPNESLLRSQFGTSIQANQLRIAMAQLFEVQPDWLNFNAEQIINMHQKTLPSANVGHKTQMLTLDAIQLASLDPYIARMVGFYYIDRLPTMSAHGYIIEADYGNRLWPLSYREPRRPNGYALMPSQENLDGVNVLAPVGRLVYEWSDTIQTYLLTIRGFPIFTLRLRFEKQAQEVVLWYESDRTEENLSNIEFLNRVTANVIREKGLWKLTIISDVPMLGFDIRPRSQSTWKIQRIEWRHQTGKMGVISSNCSIVNHAVSNRVVPSPILTNAEVSPSPLTLKHPGIVTPVASDLHLSFLKQKPELLDPSNPVRMLYGRINGTEIEPINRNELTIVPLAEPTLPTLRLWMPFDGTYKNYISGHWAEANGTRFIQGGPEENAERFSLLLLGNKAIGLPLELGLKIPGVAFSVFVWIKVDHNLTENYHIPVFNNGLTNGFSLGVRRSGNVCKTHLILNGSIFESSQTFPKGQWVPIGFNYNENKITLFTFGAVSEFDTDLGSLTFNSGGVGIGGNFTRSYSGASRFFRGQIADISVWSEAINWWEAKGRIQQNKDRMAQHLATTPMFYMLPTQNFNTTRSVVKKNLPALRSLQKELSIHAWVKIKPGREYPTIIGNDWLSSFWLGLESSDNRLKCWLNGTAYFSTSALTLNQWVHVGLTVQEGYIKFYIGGFMDASRVIPIAPIRSNATGQPLRVGGDTNNTYLLLGSVADLRIYPFAITPNQAETEYGIFNYSDRALANGTYTYSAANVDLFGRLSNWGSANTQTANSLYQINAPLSLRVAINRIRLSVSTVRLVPQSEVFPRAYWEVVTVDESRLTDELLSKLPRNEVLTERQMQVTVMGKNTPPEARTIRQNFEIKQTHRRTGSPPSIVWELWDLPFAQLHIQLGDYLELQYDTEAQLEWQWSGLQQVFNPGITHFQVFGRSGAINEWQGRVAAITPGIDERHWSVTTNLNIPGNPNELTQQICSINKQAFVVEEQTVGANVTFQLRYDGYPSITPELNGSFVLNIPQVHAAWQDVTQTAFWESSPTPNYPITLPAGTLNPATSTTATITYTKVTDSEINALRINKNVDWLENDDTFWRLQINNFHQPSDAPHFSAKDYVPSALVINQINLDAGPNGIWDAWYVHWHEWESENTLSCWVSLKDEKKGGPIVPPTIRIESDYPIKFYSGRKFYTTAAIHPPSDEQETTLPWHFAVTARAMTMPHAYAMSRFTSVITVDRRRPPAPPKPLIVSINKADLHNESEAVLHWSWMSAPLAGFNLYRATDTAIYLRDLDQRRLRQGYYADIHPLADDGFGNLNGDVHAFLSAVQHKDPAKIAPNFLEVFSKPLTALTFEDLFSTDKNDAHWQALNRIWQYWADRFYPALSDAELRNLAERQGNETAFTLVNNQPINNIAAHDGKVHFLDTVNGVVSNRYFYRLRTMALNLSMSTEWGTVSDGKAAGVPASKPRTPSWIKVEAGDRQIRLEWTLNHEKDFKEYLLYRATDETLLNHLRWAEIQQPSGLSIQRIPDSRILTTVVDGETSILFPEGVSPPLRENLIGIYCRVEFSSQDGLTPASAINLLLPDTTVNDNSIRTLRRVAQGTEVAIVYMENDTTQSVLLNHANANLPYSDNNLEGLQDYYYRITAVSSNNVRSDMSKPIKTKTLDDYHPEHPVWNIPSLDEEGALLLSWHTEMPLLRCLVERKVSTYSTWEVIGGWLERGTYSYKDTSRTVGFTYDYRLIVMDNEGRRNAQFTLLSY